MIRAFRWVSAFLAWRELRRDAGPRPGNDNQWREWLPAKQNRDNLVARLVAGQLSEAQHALDELDRQVHALHLHDVSTAATTPLRLLDILQAAARWRAELDAQRKLADLPVDDEDLAELRYENGRLRGECDGLAALLLQRRAELTARDAEVGRQRDLLGVLWLYVDWRYVTRQLTTEQKNLWADAVDTTGDPDEPIKVDRWWMT